MWQTGVYATSSVKEKINEYQIGKSILYFGGKVYEGVIYIGGKIIEKGSDLISMAHRITGSEDNNANNNNYIDIDEENNNKNNNNNKITNSDFENNYGILNDQNENLLV